MKPRVVLDSNVYISGLIFGGIPGAILVLARIERFVLCASEHIQDEFRPHWRRSSPGTWNRFTERVRHIGRSPIW
jgi:predicted nucleic acid-binding protein